MQRSTARTEAARVLGLVGMPEPAARLDDCPHQLSGGVRQRAMIAMALACRPALMIADEPTTALDVTIQAQAINLLKELQAEFKLTYIFISHDLGLVEYIADRVAAMYLGWLIELADKQALYRDPLHPYTQALLSAAPVPDPHAKKNRILLSGDVPSPINPPAGCSFHPRCRESRERCSAEAPVFRELAPGRWVACHNRWFAISTSMIRVKKDLLKTMVDGERELRNTRMARKGGPGYCLRAKASGNVTTPVDRLKAGRLKEKTRASIIALQSSA